LRAIIRRFAAMRGCSGLNVGRRDLHRQSGLNLRYAWLPSRRAPVIYYSAAIWAGGAPHEYIQRVSIM